jgi:hypothetical protein
VPRVVTSMRWRPIWAFRSTCAGRLRRDAAVPERHSSTSPGHPGPEDIAKLSAAFEAALGKLGLTDRTDPLSAEVAKVIIEFAKQGERDAERLCALAVQQISK